ncbi:MAG: tetratricopeptide repeat protein [Nitrospinae bacterium]|nr:tetratricopeptide repeat protein [Nitrospinota bacterium]
MTTDPRKNDIEDCREVVEKNPGDAQAHFKLGLACRKAKRFEEAAQAYKISLQLDRDNTRALHGLAIAYRKLKRYDKSIAACRQALKLDPNHAKIHFNLALVFEEQGKWEEAIAQHHKVLALDPEDFQAHYNLARAYDAVKDGSKAIQHTQKAESVADRENDEEGIKESQLLLAALIKKYGDSPTTHG